MQRRNFVKKSVAAAIVAATPLALTGLVRADGGGSSPTQNDSSSSDFPYSQDGVSRLGLGGDYSEHDMGIVCVEESFLYKWSIDADQDGIETKVCWSLVLGCSDERRGDFWMCPQDPNSYWNLDGNDYGWDEDGGSSSDMSDHAVNQFIACRDAVMRPPPPRCDLFNPNPHHGLRPEPPPIEPLPYPDDIPEPPLPDITLPDLPDYTE